MHNNINNINVIEHSFTA